MRYALLVASILGAASVAQSQSAVRAPQSVSTDTTTSEFEVNGLKVILRRNTATDVIAANLYLLGGSRQLTPSTQGIEALLFAASGAMTKQAGRSPGKALTPDAFHRTTGGNRYSVMAKMQ